MNYLLDTHAIIWYLEESPDLPQPIADIIDNPKNIVSISSASLWEITIKASLGKLDLKLSLGELFSLISTRDFQIIQVENEHLLVLSQLPFVHKDPFDRLLIATSKAENVTIITVDENIQKYDVSWIW
jgi:PIN domain nuclease of toxin-antitoxin system